MAKKLRKLPSGHWGIAIFILCLALFPLLTVNNPYYINVMVFVGINTIIVVGLNLLMGYAGQISLGHAAFYGIGAYCSGLLTAKYGCSPWLALPAAVALTASVAYLIGLPTLRLKGHYLAMATLGFGMVVYIVLRQLSWLTGDSSGLLGIPGISIGRFKLDTDLKYYFLVWTMAVGVLMLSRNIVNSRIGRALRAVEGSETAARTLGVDTARYKLQVFALSAAYAGLAGFLYAHFMGFIGPPTFGFKFSIELVTMVVVGGMASIWGSVLGAAFLTILPECLRVAADYDIVIYGLLLMVVMIFMPKGLTRTTVDLLRNRWTASPVSQTNEE